MKEIIKVIASIRETGSRIEKENILADNKGNAELLEILQFVFDTNIKTGLSDKKMQKSFTGVETVRVFDDIFGVMNFLRAHNTGSDSTVRALKSFISKFNDPAERELYYAIIVKDLQLGLSKSTLNKVYGKTFIHKHAPMLMSKYDPAYIEGKDFTISVKEDGERATAFHTNDGIKIMSRSGKVIKGLEAIEKTLKHMPVGFAYDGELLAENPENLNSKDLFRKTASILGTDGVKAGINFVLFDMIDAEEFVDGESECNYAERQEHLDITMLLCVEDNDPIKRVKTLYAGNDISVVPGLLKETIDSGKEGLIINIHSGKYQTKRVKDVMKVKEFHTVDLRVSGIIEHKRGDKVGSLVVDYKGSLVACGSGLTNELREEFWNTRDTDDSIIGKIVEVQYFEETTNKKDDSLSLRFPVFLRIRDDKTEPSYN